MTLSVREKCGVPSPSMRSRESFGKENASTVKDVEKGRERGRKVAEMSVRSVMQSTAMMAAASSMKAWRRRWILVVPREY